jgi:hypothetical protein
VIPFVTFARENMAERQKGEIHMCLHVFASSYNIISFVGYVPMFIAGVEQPGMVFI